MSALEVSRANRKDRVARGRTKTALADEETATRLRSITPHQSPLPFHLVLRLAPFKRQTLHPHPSKGKGVRRNKGGPAGFSFVCLGILALCGILLLSIQSPAVLTLDHPLCDTAGRRGWLAWLYSLPPVGVEGGILPIER